LTAVLAIAGLVFYLSMRTRQAPLLPTDADHERFVTSVACLTCHGPDGALPQSTNHPVRNDCMSCQGRP